MIYADQRWIGDHGIGRFSRHVLSRLNARPVILTSHPAAPLDPWHLQRALRHLTPNDLFFSPGYNSPLFCNAPFVLTIHDLNHIDRPENSSGVKRLYYATILKRACNRAARILTVSDFSRSRIITWAGVPEETVVNVRCGVDAQYNPEVAPFDLHFPYLLCVSNRKRHKNELRTVEAFASAHLDRKIRLVFTGHPNPELTTCISSNHLTSRVHFVGNVPDDKLPSLYRSAEALVFVSLYEGFGLPVLEAMACGTPVLTSNTSALPETAGGAALLVAPTSVEQIARGLEQIVGDSTLRAALREKGLARSAQFSWAATASTVVGLLSTLAQHRQHDYT